MLIVKNIVKKFHGKKILDDVSFSAAPGEIVVLLGQSGVGKSTILRVLSNLETIDSGSIELDHGPIDFKKVGMVFQDFNLFAHMTVQQNLTVPLTKVALKSEQEAQTIAHLMLDRFNVLSKAQDYPVALSGGQKQRVALARALCLNPQVLCLDEPTSALDPQLTSDVAKIITELAEQQMVIVIATHDIGLLEALSCTIHLMRDGKIIQSATSKMLQENPESFINIKNFVQGK
ncbi:MAG: ATP-binding cassette domain-containing protein [Candidatus Dependentiae bacterium]|nr:ATP-binding cassette domain-containing protein [Candidatus Dependentiae bacterium]